MIKLFLAILLFSTLSVSSSPSGRLGGAICPERDGVVVYQARVLLNSLFDKYELYYSNCQTAIQLNSMRIGAEQTETTTATEIEDNIILYPNPTTGSIYFSVKHLPINNYKTEVFDVAGKMVFSLKK